MSLQDAMDNWDVGTRDLVNRNIPSVISFVGRVCEEEDIAPVKGWFHGTTAGTARGWIEHTGAHRCNENK